MFYKRRKPKYETRYQKDRTVKILEMTPASSKYQGYTVIEGFEGKNKQDLQEKVDTYLEKLMEFINEPIEDCPNCHGRGVILNNKFEKNTR